MADAAGECGVLSRGALAERLAEAEQRLREMSAEHQRSLEELAASERRYRMLAENATDVVYAIDPSGMISWISPSVEEILGWLPADLIGKPLLEILNPDDLDLLSPRLIDLSATGAGKGNVEMRYLDAAGAWRWMSVTGRVLRDEHGELVGGIRAARRPGGGRSPHGTRRERATVPDGDGGQPRRHGDRRSRPAGDVGEHRAVSGDRSTERVVGGALRRRCRAPR